MLKGKALGKDILAIDKKLHQISTKDRRAFKGRARLLKLDILEKEIEDIDRKINALQKIKK